MILQEYPVPGSQRVWTSLLLVPVVLICLSDALPVILEKLTRRFSVPSLNRLLTRHFFLVSLALSGMLTVVYYQKMNMAGLKAAYFSYSPLGLAGTGSMRLPRYFSETLRVLVDETKHRCDGWLGFPEFDSLYLWTGTTPPGARGSNSVLNLKEEAQYRLIGQMETYAHPCILYTKENLKVLARNTPVDSSMPLVRYIRSQYISTSKIGWFQLMTKKEPKSSN
jgi:hypothetical protein